MFDKSKEIFKVVLNFELIYKIVHFLKFLKSDKIFHSKLCF